MIDGEINRQELLAFQPAMIHLMNQRRDHEIFMNYGGGLENAGNKLRNCLQGMDSPFTYLWSPTQKLSFKDAVEKFLDFEDMPERLSLEEATGMTIAEFYNTLQSKGKVCIETPKSLWP